MKGIMFREDLFKSIIIREKTQTRRLVKFPEGYKYERAGPYGPPQGPSVIAINESYDRKLIYPRYYPKETVYLKEPYFVSMEKPHYLYGNEIAKFWPKYYWKNKLFQPESAARYFIQITDVTVQRLQKITEAEAIAEGFKSIGDFQGTWISLYGFNSWPDNPFVWKYTFERQAVTEGLISFILNNKDKCTKI